jgi:hypothetical protein
MTVEEAKRLSVDQFSPISKSHVHIINITDILIIYAVHQLIIYTCSYDIVSDT